MRGRSTFYRDALNDANVAGQLERHVQAYGERQARLGAYEPGKNYIFHPPSWAAGLLCDDGDVIEVVECGEVYVKVRTVTGRFAGREFEVFHESIEERASHADEKD